LIKKLFELLDSELIEMLKAGSNLPVLPANLQQRFENIKNLPARQHQDLSALCNAIRGIFSNSFWNFVWN
jgi:hypothetical protein